MLLTAMEKKRNAILITGGASGIGLELAANPAGLNISRKVNSRGRGR